MEVPMFVFLIGTVVLVITNLVTDHEARREGFNDLTGRYHFGS
jgi:sensor domain CHASE-containing protein